jgi:hypothetical protein
MSLEKWLEYGWLKAEQPSREEIDSLFSIVRRSLKDAEVTAISDDLRFQAAFSAALTAANIALRASGFRTRVQTGHHQKIVESLELTLKANSLTIRKLKAFSKKRNAISYDSAGNISEQELEEVINLARQLQITVTSWIKEHHPDLVTSP